MAYIDSNYGNELETALRKLVSRPALGQPWFGFHESEVPAGVLLFTAGTHSRILYADFWQYVQDKNLVKTEEEWQSIYSTQGWCPFYSDGDGIDTFRMPILEESEKLVGIWAISAPQQPIPDATVEGIISELGVASNNALEANAKAETAINGLNGVVRSVNGVSADAVGNVEVSSYAFIKDENLTSLFSGNNTNGDIVLSQPYTNFSALIFLYNSEDDNFVKTALIYVWELQKMMSFGLPYIELLTGEMSWELKVSGSTTKKLVHHYDGNCNIRRVWGVK